MRSQTNHMVMMFLLAVAAAGLLATAAMAEETAVQSARIVTGAGPSLQGLGSDGRCPQGMHRLIRGGQAACAKCDEGRGYYPMVLGGKPLCVRLQMRPSMETPKGYQPTYQEPSKDGGCAQQARLVTFNGAKRCVSCKPGYVWHEYYGQGRCIKCKPGEKLGNMGGGKVSCLRCPPGALLSPPHPTMGYRCSCPGGLVLGVTPRGFKCIDPKKR